MPVPTNTSPDQRLAGLNLFLSYSSSDRDLALRVRNQLTEQGARVWWDEDSLLVGAELRLRLRDGIASCHAIIALISKTYLAGRWTLMELGAGWISDLPVYQVLVDLGRGEAPLPDLTSCALWELDTRLAESLFAQRTEMRAQTSISAPDLSQLIAKEIERVAKENTSIDSQAIDLLGELLSTNVATRIRAQNMIKDLPAVRDAVLSLVLRLSESFVDHVRAEAYFCLGLITNSRGEFLVSERALALGLRDPSLWVAACCAAGLRERVPLEPQTIELLNASVRRAQVEFWRNPDAAALSFRAHEALQGYRLVGRT